MNIEEVISRNRICLVKNQCTKNSALDKLIDIFIKDEIVDNKYQFHMDIEKREEEFCTYVGHEIAIPHAISSAVRQAGIAFLKSEEAFVYGVEGELVKMMFMLAIPKDSNEQHLRMLSLLASQLMHKEFRNALMDAKDEDAVYQIICNI